MLSKNAGANSSVQYPTAIPPVLGEGELIPLITQGGERGGQPPWMGRKGMRSCCCRRGAGHHPRSRSAEGAAGAAKRREIESFWAALRKRYLWGSCQGPRGGHSWQWHGLLGTACPLPGQLGSEERLSLHVSCTSCGKHSLHSFSLPFC